MKGCTMQGIAKTTLKMLCLFLEGQRVTMDLTLNHRSREQGAFTTVGFSADGSFTLNTHHPDQGPTWSVNQLINPN